MKINLVEDFKENYKTRNDSEVIPMYKLYEILRKLESGLNHKMGDIAKENYIAGFKEGEEKQIREREYIKKSEAIWSFKPDYEEAHKKICRRFNVCIAPLRDCTKAKIADMSLEAIGITPKDTGKEQPQ